MNQNYYPIDFEAQYQETSEKMIEISNKFKDVILNYEPDSTIKIQEELDITQSQIEERGLQFRKQSIYSQFASGQLMAERRKQTPQMCPECGQELKKPAQCEFCAQLFCKKCCSRDRMIPFVSKDVKLCCEQCHWKFVKLFDNKQFYEEKEKLANVINFVRNKTNKLLDKINAKKIEVQSYKGDKRNDKIKEKGLEVKIQQEEKKFKQMEEEYRRVISEKAQRIKEAQRNKELQKNKQEQRRRKLQEDEQERLKRARLEQIKLQAERREKQQRERLVSNSNSKSMPEKNNQNKLQQIQKNNNSKRQAQLIEAEIARKNELQMRKKDKEIQELKKLLEARNKEEKKRKDSQNSINQKNDFLKAQTPKQSLVKQTSDKERYIDTTSSYSNRKRQRRQSEDLNAKPYSISNTKLQAPKYTIQQASNEAGTQQQPESGIQKSLATLLGVRKDDDTKSVTSNMSKSYKRAAEMNINELLGAKIQPSRNTMKNNDSSKLIDKVESREIVAKSVIDMSVGELMQKAQNISSTSANKQRKTISVDQKFQNGLQGDYFESDDLNIEEVTTPKKVVINRTNSVKIEAITEKQFSEDEIKFSRDEILRNSTLMSSTSKENQQPSGENETPSKCACEIM